MMLKDMNCRVSKDFNNNLESSHVNENQSVFSRLREGTEGRSNNELTPQPPNIFKIAVELNKYGNLRGPTQSAQHNISGITHSENEIPKTYNKYLASQIMESSAEQ